MLESIAQSVEPRTPVLDCRISKSLEPSAVGTEVKYCNKVKTLIHLTQGSAPTHREIFFLHKQMQRFDEGDNYKVYNLTTQGYGRSTSLFSITLQFRMQAMRRKHRWLFHVFMLGRQKINKHRQKMYERANGGIDRQTTEGQIADIGPFNPLQSTILKRSLCHFIQLFLCLPLLVHDQSC